MLVHKTIPLVAAILLLPFSSSAHFKSGMDCFRIDERWLDAAFASNLQIESVWRAPMDLTFTAIWCETDVGTAGLDLNVDDGTPAGVNGSDISCAVSTGTLDTSFAGDTQMLQGETLDIDVGTLASSPTELAICWRYDYTGYTP